MRYLATTIMCLMLYGCYPVVREFYLPVDPSLQVLNRTCGWDPSGGYSNQVLPNTGIAIQFYPRDTGVDVGIQVVMKGLDSSHWKAGKPLLTVWRDDQPHPLLISVEFDAPRQMLEGYTHVIGNARIDGLRPMRFRFTLSGFEVNNAPVKVENVSMELVKKSGVVACVQ